MQAGGFERGARGDGAGDRRAGEGGAGGEGEEGGGGGGAVGVLQGGLEGAEGAGGEGVAGGGHGGWAGVGAGGCRDAFLFCGGLEKLVGLLGRVCGWNGRGVVGGSGR